MAQRKGIKSHCSVSGFSTFGQNYGVHYNPRQINKSLWRADYLLEQTLDSTQSTVSEGPQLDKSGNPGENIAAEILCTDLPYRYVRLSDSPTKVLRKLRSNTVVGKAFLRFHRHDPEAEVTLIDIFINTYIHTYIHTYTNTMI